MNQLVQQLGYLTYRYYILGDGFTTHICIDISKDAPYKWLIDLTHAKTYYSAL